MPSLYRHVSTPSAWSAWDAREAALRDLRRDDRLCPLVRQAVQSSRHAQDRERQAPRGHKAALRQEAQTHLRQAVALARETVQPHYPYPVTDFEVRSVVCGLDKENV